jgi:hypothetical protein
VLVSELDKSAAPSDIMASDILNKKDPRDRVNGPGA